MMLGSSLKKSPIAAGKRRQNEYLTFYASTRLRGCRDEGRLGVLWVQRPSRAAFRPSLPPASVSPAEDRPILCRLAAIHAGAAARDFLAQHGRLIYWDAAHGGAGFLFDFGFAVGVAAPRREGKPAFHGLLELVVGRCLIGVGAPESQSLVVHRLV